MMKRRLFLCIVLSLALVVVPVGSNPTPQFILSSNGYELAYTGSAGPDSSQGNYTLTWSDEMTDYTGIKNTAGEAYVILNFSIAPMEDFGGFNYSVMHGAYADDDGNSELWVYDWINEDWVYLGDGGKGTGGWTNGSATGSRYSDGIEILIKSNSTDSDSGAGVAVQIAWIDLFTGPTWLEGYFYRTQIYLTGSAGAGTDYVLKWRVEYGGGSDGGQIVYCSSHCQTDFGDIRWTESDAVTELNYYLDAYDSGEDSTFYVQISDNLDTDKSIFIYYGTAGTTKTTSSGSDTFYEWLDYTNTTGWTTSHISVSAMNSYIRFWNPTTTHLGYAYRADLSYPTNQWRMLIRMKTISLGTTDRTLIDTYDGLPSHIFSEFEAPALYDQTYYAYWNGSSPLTHGASWIEGEEYVAQITVDESESSNGVDYIFFYSDGKTSHGGGVDKPFRIGSPTHADGIQVGDYNIARNIDARMKYFAIMKNIDNEPYTSNYGPEQGQGPPPTTSTTTTTTTFIIWTEEWSFNAAFIIMGLVMVPASTLYLVHGGRSSMSSNKLLYGLVAFLMGCALFIGGIMP